MGQPKSVPVKQDNELHNDQNIVNNINVDNKVHINNILVSTIVVLIVLIILAYCLRKIWGCHKKIITREVNTAILAQWQRRLSYRRAQKASEGDEAV